MATTKGSRVDFLSLTGLHEELELWYKQWPLVPIHLLGWCRWIWVSLSLFLNLSCWLRFWVLFGGGGGSCPLPVGKILGWEPRWNIRDIPTRGLDTEWCSVERYQGIPTQSKDSGWGAGWRCQENCPPGGKVLGREARLGKKLRNTWGLAKKCWGRTIVRDWMILVEWLRGWSDTFPQLDCFYRICQDKSEENMKAFLWRKGTRLLPANFGFLRWLRNLLEWRRPSPHTMQWSHRETHSLIKILARPGVAHKNWPFSDPSSHGGLRLSEAESETRKMSWNNSRVIPGGV